MERLNYIKMANFSKIIYKFGVRPIKISTIFFYYNCQFHPINHIEELQAQNRQNNFDESIFKGMIHILLYL